MSTAASLAVGETIWIKRALDKMNPYEFTPGEPEYHKVLKKNKGGLYVKDY